MTKKKRIITLPRYFESENYERQYFQKGYYSWSVAVSPERSKDMRYWLYNFRIAQGAHGSSATAAIPALKETIRKHIEECVDVLRELDGIKAFELTETQPTEEKEN